MTIEVFPSMVVALSPATVYSNVTVLQQAPKKTPGPQINPFPIPLIKGLFSADKVEVEIILITTILVQTNKQTNDYRV